MKTIKATTVIYIIAAIIIAMLFLAPPEPTYVPIKPVNVTKVDSLLMEESYELTKLSTKYHLYTDEPSTKEQAYWYYREKDSIKLKYKNLIDNEKAKER